MAQNHTSFEIALKKGELGESIIREYLENKGWVVYFPFTKDRAHYFDMLATKDKGAVIACDVKTKARLNYMPSTGINVKTLNQYQQFVSKTGVPFFLVFIDDKSGDVHSMDIRSMPEGQLIAGGKIIVWPVASMKYLFNIGGENVERLSAYDQRNYEYAPTHA